MLAPIDFLTKDERSAIAEIEATTNILSLVTRLTSMRFAGIAKFTDKDWIVCSTYDPTNFGIETGETVEIETTLCNEFRRNPEALFLQNVSADKRFSDRPIVKRYSIDSYAGVPIFLPDGTLYGALCALDSRAILFEDPDLAETLQLFARLVGCIFFANLESPPTNL